MNKEEHINKLAAEAMESINNINRATPKPFLLTRINTRLRGKENAWENIGRLIGRPKIAIAGLATLIIINVMAVLVNRRQHFTPKDQSTQAPADEYSYTAATIYDVETTEP